MGILYSDKEIVHTTEMCQAGLKYLVTTYDLVTYYGYAIPLSDDAGSYINMLGSCTNVNDKEGSYPLMGTIPFGIKLHGIVIDKIGIKQVSLRNGEGKTLLTTSYAPLPADDGWRYFSGCTVTDAAVTRLMHKAKTAKEAIKLLDSVLELRMVRPMIQSVDFIKGLHKQQCEAKHGTTLRTKLYTEK